MVRAADDGQVGGRPGRAEPRAERGDTTFRGGHLGRIQQLAVDGADERLLDPGQRHGIGRGEEQVHAGVDRREDIEHLGRTLGECPHVERVRDRHALEAEVAPQQVGHDGP